MDFYFKQRFLEQRQWKSNNMSRGMCKKLVKNGTATIEQPYNTKNYQINTTRTLSCFGFKYTKWSIHLWRTPICVPLLLSLSWQNDMDRIIIIEFWGQRWILMMPHHIEYRWRNGHEMHTQNRTQHSHSNAIMGHRLDNIHSYHIIKIWFSRKWWYRNERYLMKMRCMGHH